MNYYKNSTLPVLALALLPLMVMASPPGHDKRDFTEEFECSGVNVGDLEAGDYNSLFVNSEFAGAVNQYFLLAIGGISYLSNMACVIEGECDELEEIEIEVLGDGDNETVVGIETRVVEEREWEDSQLVEVSRNFFAECIGSGDVFYFGEDVEVWDEDLQMMVEADDQWRAGGDNRPGLIMPGGSFLLGARYFQEVAPDVALDRGEHVEMGLPFLNIGDYMPGAFNNCVQVNDTNALEDPKGKEIDEKIYCPGIGLVKDEDAELTNITRP